MNLLRKIFGAKQKEIWIQFAEEIDGDFIEEGLLKAPKVVGRFENWIITLDTYTEFNGKTGAVCTRMRTQYSDKDGFDFKIYRNAWIYKIGKIFGMKDIDTGYPEFDKKFIIKGNNESKLIDIFSSEKIQNLMDFQDYMVLEVKTAKNSPGVDLPEGVSELHFQIMGVIRDIEKLRNLYMLFALLLNKLCIMDSAYEKEPHIILK